MLRMDGEEGEVVVRLRTETQDDAEVGLCFSVSDTGVGIGQGERSRIFEAFLVFFALSDGLDVDDLLGLATLQATVIQGGNPSVHDAASFDGASASLEDILSLTDELLLHRSSSSGPCIFVCLGHQLAAASHIRLLKRAVREVANVTHLPLDPEGTAVASLQRVCRRIAEVGESLPVVKNGKVLAEGWHAGWHAWVDRAPARVLRVNGDRLGVVLGLLPSEAAAELHEGGPGFLVLSKVLVGQEPVATGHDVVEERTLGRYVYTDYTRCIGCHICADVCPTGYIKMGLGE